MAVPSIEAVSITKKYGSFTALSRLDLKIEGAKCVGFLGPNGAGKTTTLKIFCDMIRAYEGEAYLNGVQVRKNKKQALSSCGVLVESPEIYHDLTAREALSMFAEIKGIPREERRKRVEEALAEVRMNEWFDKKVGKLSKGMKQRTNIAASLLGDPDILLLDEPTTGLDPRGMAEVRQILKNVKKRSRLIFMSSHLLNEVSDVCDEVAMISRGKLLFYDKVENAALHFGPGDNVFEVEFARPLDRDTFATLKTIEFVDSVESIDPKNIRLQFSGGSEAQEEIVSKIASMKIGLLNFRASSAGLEDAYLNLVTEVS